APLWDCSHSISADHCISITGGTFIDSPAFPAVWRGQYFFADNATGYISVLHVNAARDGVADAGPAREIIGRFNTPNLVFPVAVRRGNDGNPYYVCLDIQDPSDGVGKIARLVPSDFDGGATGGGAGGGAAGGGTGGAGGAAGGVAGGGGG